MSSNTTPTTSSSCRSTHRSSSNSSWGIRMINNSKQQQQECILEIYSHVQTRVIPLRWSSPADIKTYRPRVLIGTDPLSQARAVRNQSINK
jgi:hypothetical protein